MYNCIAYALVLTYNLRILKRICGICEFKGAVGHCISRTYLLFTIIFGKIINFSYLGKLEGQWIPRGLQQFVNAEWSVLNEIFLGNN